MEYKNKNILAPMVRVTTLPMRLLALKYGADIVYTEEIVDFKILKSTRTINNNLKTIDYIMNDGSVVFRTCAEEKDHIVLQLATSNAERGLRAAKMIESDICAVDLNMGCPKDYSVKGGMGAAMLRNPENSCKVLRTLVENLSIPVTCKIRILHQDEKTIDLVRQLVDTGIKAIAVHGRFTDERPRNPVHDDVIKMLSELFSDRLTVIANGGSQDFIKSHHDIAYFKQLCAVNSVMIGRAAMHNPSVFHDFVDLEPPTAHEIVQEYLKYAVRCDNYLSSSKYCIIQMLYQTPECPGYRETLSAASNKELCEIWGLSDFYSSFSALHDDKSAFVEPLPKRFKVDSGKFQRIINARCKFLKRLYGKTGWSPKLALYEHCTRMKWENPLFTIEENPNSRMFYSTLVVNNVLYTNEFGDKNKRFTEQAVSCICLDDLGILPQEFVDQGLLVDKNF